MFARLFSDVEGISHFEDIPLPEGWSTVNAILGADWISLDAHHVRGWAPIRQHGCYVALSGHTIVTASDGEERVFSPGDVILAEDVSGAGHCVRVTGEGPARYLRLSLVHEAQLAQAAGKREPALVGHDLPASLAGFVTPHQTVAAIDPGAADPRVVGERIRLWRARRGLSQDKLAELLGISQPTLSNYERGKREVPLHTVIQLIGALNIGLGELIDTDELIVARDSLLGRAVQSAALSAG